MHVKTLARLRYGVAPLALFLGMTAPAMAQTDPTATTTGPASVGQAEAQTTADDTSGQDIVVTGTLFRRTNTETPSPVSVITAADLNARGVTTIADAIQTISASNGGSVPQGFQNAFASGAQGVSLRGLGVSNTLILFDGLRPSYYPLADDGQRSFADLNTIPSAIVERIETLRDGASSLYGADAVAGVVNVILRREIRGVEGRAEAGVAERGTPSGQRLALTAGYGSLADQGFNFYVSGEYQHQSRLYARDRGFPYNTNNLQSIVRGGGYTGANGDTVFLAPSTANSSSNNAATVRPATFLVPGNIFSGVAVPRAAGGLYQVIQNGGCAGQGLISHTNLNGTYCEQDVVNDYTQIQPDQTRFGGTAHLTVNVGGDAQAYLVGTYYQSDIFQRRAPSTLRSNNPVFTYGLALPARLRNGQLNPNNPFAAAGQGALIFYTFGDIPVTLENKSETYRVAGGINGHFGGGAWTYQLNGTYMRTELTQTRNGFINVAGLTNAILDGTYNFRDPASNSAAVRASISPEQQSRAHTEEVEVQGTISRELFQLPGGPLNLAVGGEYRYENIYDPNPNPGGQFIGINTFQAVGHRNVASAFFELGGNLFQPLELNVSGRYDHYSTGFDHFSPKVGFKFTPIRQLAIRGTYSEGFRAPAIPETNGNVIGFVNFTPSAAYQAAHGNNSYSTSTYSLGLNSIGNPNLRPETSRSFTGGAVFQPTRWLSLTVDYYNIHKTNLIFNPADSTFASIYLAGGALPAGITITPNPVDPEFPNLRPTPAFVNAAYTNGQSLQTSGIDAQIQANFRVGAFRFTSVLEGTEILEYTINTGSAIYRYVGTLGSYNVTSASGTPRWRATWQNTVEYGPFSLTGTAYFTSGYKAYAADYDPARDCSALTTPESTYIYNGDISRAAGPALQCNVRHSLTLDLNAGIRVNENFQLYATVFNVFDQHAPFDPNTYGGNNYNPAWGASGIIGRYFKAGATFRF